MQKFIKMKLIIVLSLVIFIIPSVLFGATKGLGAARESLTTTGGAIDQEYNEAGRADLKTMVGNIIQTVLGLLGTVLLLVIVYAGYSWLASGGNQEKVAIARKWITNAVIGFIIVAGAWVITSFVMQSLAGSAGERNTGALQEKLT